MNALPRERQNDLDLLNTGQKLLNTQQRIMLVGAQGEALLKAIDRCAFDAEPHEPDRNLIIQLLSLLFRS